MTFLRSLLAMFLVLPLAACALSGEAIEGRVLEEGTNKPIAGAIVAVRWMGRTYAFVDSQGSCYHVETAMTDEQGRYQTRPWRQPRQDYGLSFDHIAIDAYKPGYGFPDKHSRVQGIEYLAPFRGTREQRLGYLVRMLESTRCGSQNDSERNLYALYLAMHDEAKGIAVSKGDAEIVDTLRYWSSFVILDKSKPTTRDAKGRLINVDGRASNTVK
jgi:hypothetical protein